ncbi:T9SS type A sorting domain-containing protein [Flammeovirga pectinis]|nr:T9SS type A sorting domain-containing protein [Flammeovirga pectinis]
MLIFSVNFSYGQEEFGGFLCGDQSFIAPSFLSNDFLDGKKYTWELEGRTINNLGGDYENKSDLGFEDILSYETNSSESNVLTSNNKEFLGRQLRIRVTRGGFQSKWEYFYIFPKMLSGSLGVKSDIGFSITEEEVSSCLGDNYSLSLDNDIGNYNTGDQFNLIIYNNINDNWYTGSGSSIKLNLIENSVLEYNGSGFDIINHSKANIELTSENNKIILSLISGIADQHYSYFIQLTERLNTSNAEEILNDFKTLLKQKREGTDANNCGDPLLINFDESITKTPLTIDGDEVVSNYFSVTSDAKDYYGQPLTFSLNVDGGGYGEIDPEYNYSEALTVNAVEWPNDGSLLIYSNISSSNNEVDLNVCEDSYTLSLTTTPPDAPTFSANQSHIDNTEALGSISLFSASNDIGSTNYYNVKYKLYNSSDVFISESTTCTFLELIPGTYKIKKYIESDATAPIPTVNFYIQGNIVINNTRSSIYINSPIQFVTENLSLGNENTATINYNLQTQINTERSRYLKCILKGKDTNTFSSEIFVIDTTSYNLEFQNVPIGSYNEDALEYDLEVIEYDSSFTTVIFTTTLGSVLSTKEARPIEFVDSEFIKVPYNMGAFSNELTHFRYRLRRDSTYNSTYEVFYVFRENNGWSFMNSASLNFLNENGHSLIQNQYGLIADTAYYFIAFDGSYTNKGEVLDSLLSFPSTSKYNGNAIVEGPFSYSTYKSSFEISTLTSTKSIDEHYQIACEGDLTRAKVLIINDTIPNYITLTNRPYFYVGREDTLPININDFHQIDTDSTFQTLESDLLSAANYSVYLLEDTVHTLNLNSVDGTSLFGYYKAGDFIINEPDKLNLLNSIDSVFPSNSGSIYHISRHNGSDGKFKTQIIGGVADFEVMLRLADATKVFTTKDQSRTAYFDSLGLGTYAITSILDSNNCSNIQQGNNSINLLAPDSLLFDQYESLYDYGNLGLYEISEFGGNDGTITYNIKGGIDNYKTTLYYSANNSIFSKKDSAMGLDGEQEYLFEELTKGYYQLVVTDSFFNQQLPESYLIDTVKLITTDNLWTSGDIAIDSVIELREPDKLIVTIDSLKNYQTVSSLQDYHLKCNFGGLAKTGKAYLSMEGGIPYQEGNNYYYKVLYNRFSVEDSIKVIVTQNLNGKWNAVDSISNLVVDSLGVTIIDNLRKSNSNDTLLIAPPPLSVIYETPIKPNCIDSFDGAIQMDIQGGIQLSSNESYLLKFGNTSILFDTISNYMQGEGMKEFTVNDAYDCPCELVNDSSSQYKTSFYEVDSLYEMKKFNELMITSISDNKDTVIELPLLHYYLSDYFPFSANVISDSVSCFSIKDDLSNEYQYYNDGSIYINKFYGGSGEKYNLNINRNGVFTRQLLDISSDSLVHIDSLIEGIYTIEISDRFCNVFRPIDTIYVEKYTGPLDLETLGNITRLSNVEVGEPDPLEITITAEETLCYGLETAAMDMSIVGGHLPYTITVYIENTANIGGFDTLIDQVTTSSNNYRLENLKGNKNYRVHVSDLMSCEVEPRYKKSIYKYKEEEKFYGVYFVPERDPVHIPYDIEIQHEDITCTSVNDGEINFTSLGNMAGTQFRWKKAKGGYTPIVSITDPSQVEQLTWSNLGDDVLILQYLENAGCDWKDSQRVVEIKIKKDLEIEDIDIVKNNSSFTLLTSLNSIGSHLKIEYDNGNGYQILSDSIVTNKTPFFSNLQEGKYRVTLYYKNIVECTTDQKIIDTSIAKVLEYSSVINIIEPSCGDNADGEATFTLLNRLNTEISSIEWKDNTNNVIGNDWQIRHLKEGNYTLKLIDILGIISEKSFQLDAPDELSITQNYVESPNCVNGDDGVMALNVFGGSNEYIFEWTNLLTNQSITTLDNRLEAAVGTYQVIVSTIDNVNCNVIGEFSVPEADSLFVDDIEIINPSHYGATNGSVTIAPKGGEGPYVVYWPDQNSYGNSISGLTIGDYPLTIIDRNECTKDTIISIIEEPEPIAIAIITAMDESCFGAQDGGLLIDVTGGTSPYIVQWNNNQRGTSLTGVSAGEYIVNITDLTGHSVLFTTTVEGTTPIVINLDTLVHPSCVKSNDGWIRLTVEGGSGNYVFNTPNIISIQDDSDSYLLQGFSDGNYTIEVNDENGCSSSLYNNRFLDPDPVELKEFTVIPPLCAGDTNGSITIDSISGGSGEYIIEWLESGSNSLTLNTITEGSYTVIITDKNKGCSIEKSLYVSQPNELEIELLDIQHPTCVGDAGGTLSINVTGGVKPYSYSWSDGQITDNVIGLEQGFYTVEVIDANGCSINATYEVIDPEPISIEITHLQDVIEICNGTTFILDAGNEWITTIWTSDIGFSSSEQTAIITGAGNYELEVTTEAGCQKTVSFEVIERDDLLNANFVIESTPDNATESFVIIDLSWPLPEGVEWEIMPEVTVLDSTKHEQEIRFTQEGIHKIIMTASLGNCVAVVEREIDVVIGDNGRLTINDEIANEKSIEEEKIIFDAYPNPSDGNLNIFVEFTEVQDAQMALRLLGDGRLVWNKQLKNQSSYAFQYSNLKLPTGIYLLQLTTRNTVEVMKVMILK